LWQVRLADARKDPELYSIEDLQFTLKAVVTNPRYISPPSMWTADVEQLSSCTRAHYKTLRRDRLPHAFLALSLPKSLGHKDDFAKLKEFIVDGLNEGTIPRGIVFKGKKKEMPQPEEAQLAIPYEFYAENLPAIIGVLCANACDVCMCFM
jgi:hypothetical protein